MRNSRDRRLISGEPYEIEYIHSRFPGHSHGEVERALREAKSELSGSEDRGRIMELLRRKLK